jgi:hypothetical protein
LVWKVEDKRNLKNESERNESEMSAVFLSFWLAFLFLKYCKLTRSKSMLIQHSSMPRAYSSDQEHILASNQEHVLST